MPYITALFMQKKKGGPIYDDFSTGRYRKSGETLPNISVCFYESGAVYPLIRYLQVVHSVAVLQCHLLCR